MIKDFHDGYMHCSLPWGLVPLLLLIIHRHPVNPEEIQQTRCQITCAWFQVVMSQ